MHCPKLAELPPPPPGKIGWPWTEESLPLCNCMPDGSPWPRLSVITPSFNQGEYIEATIRSVLLQGYPDLEYFVLDGASTDNSVEIIKKYSPWLNYWRSEPDSGQSDAINRGLKMASGLFATWINSDDMLCKNALVTHAWQVGFDANVVYVGICAYMDEAGKTVAMHRGEVHNLEDLLHVRTVWCSGDHIVQPEVLFPRRLALAVGGLDVKNQYSMDFDLWGKFLLAGAKLQYTEIPFGMFRFHQKQKTQAIFQSTGSLVKTASKLTKLAKSLPKGTRNEILRDLKDFHKAYQMKYLAKTGRLGRMGLPPWLVLWLRGLKAMFDNVFLGLQE
jgi:glycosyltransferase involved in cell wall biosynthesis